MAAVLACQIERCRPADVFCPQIASAEAALKAETNADVVRDVKVQLQPLRRRARLVYFPAYIVQYTFGELLAETGERRPQHFMAVISGMGELLVGTAAENVEYLLS